MRSTRSTMSSALRLATQMIWLIWAAPVPAGRAIEAWEPRNLLILNVGMLSSMTVPGNRNGKESFNLPLTQSVHSVSPELGQRAMVPSILIVAQGRTHLLDQR